MPIILAIEPDRRQAAHLTALVHRRVKAELILVPTTAGALDAIGNRVPDLVLIPALLSPQDDAALAAALRVIAAAARVQMLTIPMLGPPRPAVKSGGVLSALRRDKSRSAEPDGCDPAVFAEQIASYLERAAEERIPEPIEPPPAEMPEAHAAETSFPAPETSVETISEWVHEEPSGDESVSFALAEVARALFSDVDLAVESPSPTEVGASDVDGSDVIEAPEVETSAPPAVEADVPVVAGVVDSVSEAEAEWATVEQLIAALQVMPLAAIEVTEEDEWIAPVRHSETAAGKQEGVVEKPEPLVWAGGGEPVAAEAPVAAHAAAKTTPPSARSEQEWVALVESLRHDVERIRTERADKPGPRPAPAPSRSRKVKPPQDEWGLFDPEQCGFAALLAKLEEVTEEEPSR